MENLTTEAKPQSSYTAPPVSTERLSVSLNLSQLLTICATGLFICFFLPWINFLGINPSGYDFAKGAGGMAQLLWSIPLFCGITILATVTKRSPRTAAQLAGASPLIVLAFGLYQEGRGLIGILASGAYLGLILGLVLLILPRRLK